MSELFEHGSGWGNYAIKGIVEIQLPDTISMLPQTLGWQLLFVAFLVWLGLNGFNAVKRYWRNRYRRLALTQLQQIQQRFIAGDDQVLRQLPGLIKATALQAYPRTDVASLHGKDWEFFLDSRYSGESFSQQYSGVLAQLSYGCPQQLKQTLDQAFWLQLQFWIETHRDDLSRGRAG